MKTLEEFYDWFMEQGAKSLLPANLYCYGPVKSAIVHRDPPFQVEFFVVGKWEGQIDPHRHPDVDSIEVGVAGEPVNFNLNGRITLIGRGVPTRVHPWDWHSVASVPGGASFYSVQKWLNGVPPTSVGLNWEGTIRSLAGTEHFEELRRRGKWNVVKHRYIEKMVGVGG